MRINRYERRSSGHFRETFNWIYIGPLFLLKSVLFLSKPAQLQTTTLCYDNRFGPDEKRRNADSFVINKPPSAQKNGVTDWSILQLLTDHWLVCGGDASDNNTVFPRIIARAIISFLALKGGGYSRAVIISNISIKGGRLVEGRLLFEEIR